MAVKKVVVLVTEAMIQIEVRSCEFVEIELYNVCFSIEAVITADRCPNLNMLFIQYITCN